MKTPFFLTLLVSLALSGWAALALRPEATPNPRHLTVTERELAPEFARLQAENRALRLRVLELERR